jgi:hypothetical protein
MMDKILFALTGLFLLTSSCAPASRVTVSYEGKLIIAYCAYAVVEIKNPDVFEEGMEWRDGRGTLYRNAFTVGNICDFYKAGLKVGDTFEYSILKTPGDKECEVCLGYIETPSLTKTIQVIRKLN